MLERLKRVNGAAATALVNAGAAGLVAMTAIIGWQVFGRYVLESSPAWAEQASLTLMIWYVFFASAAGVRMGFHIRIVALEEALLPANARRMRFVSHLIVAALGLTMAIWGTDLVIRTWEHVIPTLGLSRGLAYLALPLSGVLVTLFTIELMLEDAAGEDSADTLEPELGGVLDPVPADRATETR